MLCKSSPLGFLWSMTELWRGPNGKLYTVCRVNSSKCSALGQSNGGLIDCFPCVHDQCLLYPAHKNEFVALKSYLPVLLAELLGFIEFTSFLLSCPHSSAGLHGTCFSLYTLPSISYIFEHLLWSHFWIYYSIQRCARFEHKSSKLCCL